MNIRTANMEYPELTLSACDIIRQHEDGKKGVQTYLFMNLLVNRHASSFTSVYSC